MTGFGRAAARLTTAGRAVVEVQTLNHKFLEIECRLPDGFQSLEQPIRSLVSRAIRRGRVKVLVNLKKEGLKPRLALQTGVARHYVAQLKKLQHQLKLSGEVTLEMVLGLPQVVAYVQEDASPARCWPQIQRGIYQALGRVVRMRRQEGRHLQRSLNGSVAKLGWLNSKVRRRVPLAEQALKERLKKRIERLGVKADSRVAVAEAATLVQANDVHEELARIQSHLLGLRGAVTGKAQSPGRTIDFLAQELHREVNTLGSKVGDPATVGWIVAMKGQIEKLREQAANVE